MASGEWRVGLSERSGRGLWAGRHWSGLLEGVAVCEQGGVALDWLSGVGCVRSVGWVVS